MVLGIGRQQPVCSRGFRAATPVDDYGRRSAGRELVVLVDPAHLTEREQLQILLLLGGHAGDGRGRGESEQIIRTTLRAKREKYSSFIAVNPPKRDSLKGRLTTGLNVVYALAEEVADRMELVRPSYTNMLFNYPSIEQSGNTLYVRGRGPVWLVCR